MAYVDAATRRLASELALFMDRWVLVRTTTGREYEGILLGYTLPELTVMLGDVKDPEGHRVPRLVISGRVIAEIVLVEEPLDMEALAKRLESYFPHMVKYYPEARIIVVMDRVKVTEKGVEGGGPVAERVKAIYEEFVKEWREKRKAV